MRNMFKSTLTCQCSVVSYSSVRMSKGFETRKMVNYTWTKWSWGKL